MANTFTFTAENGIKFTTRRVNEGDRYGLQDCLVHDKQEPLIEFYDTRFPHTEYGQFVTRYNLSTLEGHDPERGLDLFGGEPSWKIDAESLQLTLLALGEEPESNKLWFSTSSGRIEFQLTKEDAETGSHTGQCYDDVVALRSVPYIASQLAEIDAKTLAEELREYGAWEDNELASHDENLNRILWLACVDIIDNPYQAEESESLAS
jgi:hypothetical protein